MLSDKLSKKLNELPPQVPPPSKWEDPRFVYGLIGAVFGVILFALIRNTVFALPGLLFAFDLIVGKVRLVLALDDLVLGIILGSALGGHLGKKALDRQQYKRFLERQKR